MKRDLHIVGIDLNADIAAGPLLLQLVAAEGRKIDKRFRPLRGKSKTGIEEGSTCAERYCRP
ncbi:hypothetical protein D3C85_1858430 [compost metagenome]